MQPGFRKATILPVFCITLMILGLVLIPPTTGAVPSQSAESILASAIPHRQVTRKLSRFAVAPVELSISSIPKKYHRTLGKLIVASQHLDRVFWQQVSEDGWFLYQALKNHKSKEAQSLAALMEIHYGPWDRLSGNSPFVGTRPKPPGAAFYPSDCSGRELAQWLQLHPEQKADILNPYTVIRRKAGGFVAIPYSQKYRQDLKLAASALREAALLCPCNSLKEFLTHRADALLSDDYYPSELKWMETTDCPLIVVFGPYEFYEDLLLGAKTSFEAIIAWKNEKETRKFKDLAGHADAILADLPVGLDVKSRLTIIKQRPITVADELYAAGEARAGAQTSAFTLPNDPRVRKEKGTRQVVFRNVAMAKFNHSWIPLTRNVVAEEQIVHVSFNSYFDLLASVELARAIAPAVIQLAEAGKTSPMEQLRQRYHVIEEAKSDVLGLFIIYWLIDRALVANRDEIAPAVTFLTAVFRVIRFDTAGAHGLAKAIVFNYLAKKRAIIYDPTTKRFRVDVAQLKRILPELMETLLKILAEGDYDKAGELIVNYGILPGDVRAKLAELRDVPVDIKPIYPIVKSLPMD